MAGLKWLKPQLLVSHLIGKSSNIWRVRLGHITFVIQLGAVVFMPSRADVPISVHPKHDKLHMLPLVPQAAVKIVVWKLHCSFLWFKSSFCSYELFCMTVSVTHSKIWHWKMKFSQMSVFVPPCSTNPPVKVPFVTLIWCAFPFESRHHWVHIILSYNIY